MISSFRLVTKETSRTLACGSCCTWGLYSNSLRQYCCHPLHLLYFLIFFSVSLGVFLAFLCGYIFYGKKDAILHCSLVSLLQICPSDTEKHAYNFHHYSHFESLYCQQVFQHIFNFQPRFLLFETGIVNIY